MRTILLITFVLVGISDGTWVSFGTTPDGATDFDPDDPKPDLDNEPPPPSTTTPTTTTTTPTTTTTTPTTTTTTPTTTTTTPTTTTTTPTTTTTTPTTTTTTPTTTTTTPTTTTTTPTTTTTTPTTTTTTPTTTPTTPTTTPTTPTSTPTTPTTTPTTPTTTPTTPTTTTTKPLSTTSTVKPPPPSDCDIELDNECLKPKQHLWELPETKELLIFKIRLRNALILDKQAKQFLLQIPGSSSDDEADTKCKFDASNGSESNKCPFQQKKLLGFWRSWNELCIVVFPNLQNVTFVLCERRQVTIDLKSSKVLATGYKAPYGVGMTTMQISNAE
ncbi:mucin-2-like [Ylistrum balloti]|uniref:mucin-2-like n=1 Tax=Ylistrum balloti TaxID=509963 RepID=UPI002905C872|nr:mucin-2-like [Ylistrum balloti]